jgi:HAE1 family hydrophobic/amphiphilic exporter-1
MPETGTAKSSAAESRYRTLLDVSSAIALQSNFQVVLRSLRQLLSTVIVFDSVSLVLLDGDAKTVRLIAFDRAQGAPEFEIGTRVVIAGKLFKGIGYEWTALSYQERMAQAQTTLLYSFSVLVIFLVLAALYESWSVPISIMLALPLGVIGGVAASSWRGLPNDVYFQIGLLTVLGLTTKNAILIVQFAKIRMEQGADLIEATLEGAKLRLRPIVMTSLAFGFGVLPLAIATGAGAGAQKAIGTSALGGMITATFLAIFFIPLFYVMVVQLLQKKKSGNSGQIQSKSTTAAEGQ